MQETIFGARLPLVIIASIGVFSAASSVVAQDAVAVKGSLYIAGKTPIDPPAGEAKLTHAYFVIEGPGATRLYRAMPGKEAEDLCRGDGWKIKRSADLTCSISRNGKEAGCDFSINVRDGTLGAGNPC